jgi:beta-lactamase superfamily II metal-dependent hydrolase
MNKPVFFIFVSLILVNVFSWSAFNYSKDNGLLEVYFFNIGQGDFSFIKTPNNEKIVIDGGPDYNLAVSKIDKDLPFWDRKIDLMIVTHPEDDHFSGLFEILKRYEVKNIVWSGEEKSGERFRNFKLAVENEQADGCLVSEVRSGDKIILSDITLDIVFPFNLDSGKDSTNGSSVVVKMAYGLNEFLFTGDISVENEKEIVDSGKDIGADVLKVAHHGSKYSTSEYFLEKVLPKVAVIQVGKNTYGHPSKETLENLDSFRAKVLRNDVNGDIEILSDGKNLQLISSAAQP